MSIEVMIPAISKRYEFLVPNVMEVKVAKKLMTQVIASGEGSVANPKQLVLYLMEKGAEAELNVSLEEAGIKDGSQLMLI